MAIATNIIRDSRSTGIHYKWHQRGIVSYEGLQNQKEWKTGSLSQKVQFILKTEGMSYVSSSQLYKQAGNSISVPVIQAILKNLLT